MIPETIYLIQRCSIRTDSNNQDYDVFDIDEDYGYFTDRDRAQEFANELSAVPKQAYDDEIAKIEADDAAYQEELAAAKALGFRPARESPWHWYPDKPDTYDIVAVEPRPVLRPGAAAEEG